MNYDIVVQVVDEKDIPLSQVKVIQSTQTWEQALLFLTEFYESLTGVEKSFDAANGLMYVADPDKYPNQRIKHTIQYSGLLN